MGTVNRQLADEEEVYNNRLRSDSVDLLEQRAYQPITEVVPCFAP